MNTVFYELGDAEKEDEDETEMVLTRPEVFLRVTISGGQSQELAYVYETHQDAQALHYASRLLGINQGIAPALRMLRDQCPELEAIPGCEINDGQMDDGAPEPWWRPVKTLFFKALTLTCGTFIYCVALFAITHIAAYFLSAVAQIWSQ